MEKQLKTIFYISLMKNIFTKDELNSFMQYFQILIRDLVICTSNIDEIIEQNNESREKIAPFSYFLGHYVALAYSFATLTLSKLFVQDEKRSLKKLMNKLENSDFDEELKEMLTKNRKLSENGSEGEYDYLFKHKADIKNAIAISREEINQAEFLVEKIKARRDSYYAHFDPDKLGEIEVESLAEIKQLSDIAEGIYNRFNSGFNNSTFMFTNLWNMKDLFAIINDHHDEQVKKRNDLDKE